MLSRFTSHFIAAVFTVGIPISLQAGTFTPNVFDDPAPVPAPNGCTNAGPNPTRCSLREAVLSANADNAADTIILDEGIYNLTIPEAGTPESGDLNVVEGDGIVDITFQGAGSDKTIINAAASLDERILHVSQADAKLTLTGITFQNGNSPGNGGGVYFSSGDSNLNQDPVTIRDCNFLNNRANGGDGGGAFLGGARPLIDVDGARFEGNTASISGGGLALEGGNPNLAMTVKNVLVLNNQALDGRGGGIYQSAANGARFHNIRAEGNSAFNPGNADFKGGGGGIYCNNGASSGNLSCEITDSILINNKADGGNDGSGGGGFYGSSGGFFRIVNTTFSGNEVHNNRRGGGAYISNGGGVEILNSTFSDNTSGPGAGLILLGTGGTLKEVTNSTFSGNQSSSAGGGLYTDRGDTLFVNNVTFVGNSADTVAGGVYNVNAPIVIRNSLFGENSSGDNQSDDCSGTASAYDSDGYNIFGSPNNADCEPDNGTNPNDQFGVDPMVAALADNGGLTFTHALLEGSPAIDGGNPAGCEDGSGADLTTDQRGFERPTGAACDIGAFEAAIADLAIEKTADESIYVVGDDITYTLTVTNNGPDAAFALVTDDLPPEVSLVSMDAACVDGAGVISCDLGSLDPGESASVQIVAQAIDDGVTDNTATVSGADIDPNPDNNSSTVSVDVLSNDTGGGCKIGATERLGAPLTWGLMAFGLAPAVWFRRRSAASDN